MILVNSRVIVLPAKMVLPVRVKVMFWLEMLSGVLAACPFILTEVKLERLMVEGN